MRSVLICGLCVALGCLSDLDRYSVQDRVASRDASFEDSSSTRNDSAVWDSSSASDSSASDSSVARPCEVETTCGASCPLPWLLAAVQDVPGGRTCGNQVLRWSIQNETSCACSSFSSRDAFPELMLSVGFVPPQTIVVGGDGEIVGIDTETGAPRWTKSIVGQAREIFPLSNSDSDVYAAVAISRRPPYLQSLRMFDTQTGSGRYTSDFTSDTSVFGSTIESVTQSSFDPKYFRALFFNGFAAADIDPWGRVRFSTPPHTPAVDGFFFHTISSLFYDGVYRTVWTGERTDLEPHQSRVFSLNSRAIQNNNRVPDGERCLLNGEGEADLRACQFDHAVPHPRYSNRSFALCRIEGNKRIVELDHTTEMCVTVTESPFESAHINRLAIALPPL